MDSYGPVILSPNRTSTGLELIWQSGTLMWADSINGPWSAVPSAIAVHLKDIRHIADGYARQWAVRLAL